LKPRADQVQASNASILNVAHQKACVDLPLIGAIR
jgi:hypothetical protein